METNPELNWGKSNLEVHLRFQGGWGNDNLTSACGWIATGMRWRTSTSSTFHIHTGRGYFDNVNAVLDGTIDVAFTTPTVTAAMAHQGRGIYTSAHPNLRAIAVLPHRDRMLFAVATEVADRYGLHTLADFAAKQPPLRIATGLNDGVNVIGYVVEKLLNEYGVAWGDLERWGGQWLVSETPFPTLAAFAKGDVDAAFHEAMMLWPLVLKDKPVRYLSVDRETLEALHQRYGYLSVDLEPGDLPGIAQPTATIDFSQWIIIARDDLPEEVAYLLTQVIVEDRAGFEVKYKHQPVQESPLYYPMIPAKMCQVAPLPLHAGAQRYYHEQGLL